MPVRCENPCGVEKLRLTLTITSNGSEERCAGLFVHPFDDLRLDLSDYAARE
jgi:hypothetical protein